MRPDQSDRGMALILMLLCLTIVSGLTAAMGASALTELLIARNHESAALARAAAEAGLNHAIEVTVNNLNQWQVNGHASRTAAMNAMFRGPDNAAGTTATDADNGSLGNLGIPLTGQALNAAAGTSYTARVYDDDDPARGETLSSADITRIGENNQPTVDNNQRMVIRATGTAVTRNTSVTMEATLVPISLPAIITNGALTISGNPTVNGANGSVHSNGNLTVSGNPTLTQNLTSAATYSQSGNPTVGGDKGGGRPAITVPVVSAIVHKPTADYILRNNGRMTNQAGTVICNASKVNDACKVLGYGWKYEGSGNWNIDSDIAANGTYYVEGDARISGNPGSPGAPLVLSILAEGNIEISGNPDLRPDLPEIMFLTNKDLKLNGNFMQPMNFEGQFLVREQLMISGNPTIAGQIIVENAASTSTLVTANSISGNPSVTYNGLVGTNTISVTAWREVP